VLDQRHFLLLLSQVRPKLGLPLSGFGELLLDFGEPVGKFVGPVSFSKKLLRQDGGVGVVGVVAGVDVVKTFFLFVADGGIKIS